VNYIIKSRECLLADLEAYFSRTPECYKLFDLARDFDFSDFPAGPDDARLGPVYRELYGGRLVLPEGVLQDQQQAFRNHYRAVNNSEAFYADLEFPWNAFQQMATEGTDPDRTVLGFVHRYDPAGDRWYLSGVRFSFEGYAGPGAYPITATDTLFDLLPDGSVADYGGGLADNNGHLYDPVYFHRAMEREASLIRARHVNMVCFAWEELRQLHRDNKGAIPQANDALFSIRFCSITSDYRSGMPKESLVPFPHCVAMYMCYDGVPLLGDGAVVAGAIFINMAADLSTLCPPNCGTYYWPQGLVPVLTSLPSVE
jgi:hypothetical protein